MNTLCFHCSEPVGNRELTAHIAGRDEAVCCHGCRAVAELIAGAGLAQYYSARSERPDRPDAALLAADAWSAYARPEVTAALVQTEGDYDSITLGVEGLRCAACTWLIDKMLETTRGVTNASTSAATGRTHVQWRRDGATLADIMRAIARAGYRPFPVGAIDVAQRQREERRSGLRHLAVAGFGMMQVMMFAVATYAAELSGEHIEPQLLALFRNVSMLVAAPVLFYAGLPILTGALRSIRTRSISMDVPVALALLLAYGMSVWYSLRGTTHEVYFDSVTMFVFFVSLGRFVQMSVRHRTTSITDALARQMPAIAHRIADAGVEDVPASSLAVGDVIVVRHGETPPGDGTLIDAETSFDESLLTGESRAVRRIAGDAVVGGTLNLGHPVRVRLTALGQRSVLAQTALLLEQAQAQRPATAGVAGVAATRFLIAVVFCAALTAAAWFWIEPARALPATLAVLVVACPCAFAIAQPAAVSAAIAALARRGLLVTHPAALESLAAIDRAILDKTGTLTWGQPAVRRCVVAAGADEDECRRIAAALEACSEHPIARALTTATAVSGGRAAIATDTRCIPGSGIEATVDGRRYRIGNAAFVGEFSVWGELRPMPESDGTVVLLADATRVLAQFELQDRLRDSAPRLRSGLSDLGITTEILSGDGEMAVNAVASTIGADTAFARQTPEQKLARLRTLQRQGQRVLMVGDGVNDAPTMGAADVSIAMGRGTALAQAGADMILMSQDLGVIGEAVTLARRTQQIVRQNLVWSAVYNFASLPLAAVGLIPPWLAALGMSASSIFVVLNATRLLPRRAGMEDPARRRWTPPAGSIPVSAS